MPHWGRLVVLCFCAFFRRELRRFRRQKDIECGAVPKFALHVYAPTKLFKNGVADGKAKARALAHLFGGEEWVKNLPQGFLIHGAHGLFVAIAHNIVICCAVSRLEIYAVHLERQG